LLFFSKNSKKIGDYGKVMGGTMQIIQTYLAQWKGLQEKLIVAQESFSTVEPVDLTPLIQEHQLTLREGNKTAYNFGN
jgi:hypothetical protein